MNWKEELSALIKTDEGLRLKPYLDSKRVLTIGYGRNLRDVGISLREAETLLVSDVSRAIEDCLDIYGEDRFSSFSSRRKIALASMSFQLGETRLRKFVKMNKAIDDGDWREAAIEAANSKWAKKDSPKRAAAIIKLFI